MSHILINLIEIDLLHLSLPLMMIHTSFLRQATGG